MNYLGTILLILLLIFINAFFAASEIAVISLRKSKLRILEENGKKQAETISRLIQNPSQFLATIQIGVTLAGFFASATGAVSLSRQLGQRLEATGLPFFSHFGEEIVVICVTIVISYLTLIFGELVPKKIALNNPEAISLRIARPLDFFSKALKPMVKILSSSTDFILHVLGVPHEEQHSATDEELKMFITEQRTVLAEEKIIIKEVFDFGDTMAYEVMTPRTDMVCIDENFNLKELIELSIRSHFSRIPVFRDDLDNILGFVHIKDLLPYIETFQEQDKKVRELLRPVHFVPVTKKIIQLLWE
ncbi:MAG: hemolysin family protein, partial [Atribacterota bacterium]